MEWRDRRSVYAEVAVNSRARQRHTFCYAISPSMSPLIGQAVWVPFGRQRLQGIVFELTATPSVEQTREIAEIIDSRPMLSLLQIQLARWISERYLSPLFDSAALMLPPGFERRVLTFFSLNPVVGDAALSLTSIQEEVLNFIRGRGRVELREAERRLGKKVAGVILPQLMRKGLMEKTLELQGARVKPKVVSNLRLAIEAEEAMAMAKSLRAKRASKQALLLEFLAAQGAPVPFSRLVREAGCSTAAITALERKGLAFAEEIQVRRDPLAHRSYERTPPPRLTPAQEVVWEEMKAALVRRQGGAAPVFLLHGVTGSGKTELYLRALAEAVAQGKKGIVLVPEIALTTQTIERFWSRFPDRVAVLHSKLSVGEQFDEWWRIKEGAFDVVVGSRGAIFAPQPDLGLIVIDEEHEWTYKQQEQSPRYHARDIALKLAELTGSVVILGSATPDVASYYRAGCGDFRLLELPERVLARAAKRGKVRVGGESGLPEVEVVDLRVELKTGNRGIFSRSLAMAIDRALAAREQVILFLNRRGAATFVQCRDCGFVLRCRRCDVSLTYHSTGEDLVCHQCNYRMAVPALCPACWSRRIRFLGIGTQKVEEEAARAFLGARLLRWDRDVTARKHSHDEILDKFVAHEADILIGTQMVAKGLDLPLVTLVGVINADIGLYLPDFRAGERTFQTLTQVAGRAGRRALEGKVIIQTYTPNHYAIAAAAKQDYASFYERELGFRRQHGNPPFSKLAGLVYAHTNAALCQKEAERMYRLLAEEKDSWGIPDTTLIGPCPAYIQKLRGRYRWQVIVRGPAPGDLLAKVPIPQGWLVDIDPVNLL